jgi:hypothetical protein
MRSATHRMKTNGTQSDEELARAGIALGEQMNEPEVSRFGCELLEAIANGEDPQQRRARHVRRLNVYFCKNYPQTALDGANLSGGSRVLYRKAHRVLLLAEQHSDQILENLAGDLVETIVGRESMIEQLAAFERISNHDAQWWQSIHAGAEAHSGIETSTPSLEDGKSSPRKKAALLLLGSVVLLVAAYALLLVFSLVSPRIDRQKGENRANTLIKSSIKADDSPDNSISDHTSTAQVIVPDEKPATATPQGDRIKQNEQGDSQRGEDRTTMGAKEVRKAPVSKTASIDREKAKNRKNTFIKSRIKTQDPPSDHTSTPQVIVHDQKPATATPPDEAIRHSEQGDQRGEDRTIVGGKEVRKALPVEVRKAIPAKFEGDFGSW